MGCATGEAKEPPPLRPIFDRRIKLEFYGTRVASDGGLLAYRELDDAPRAHRRRDHKAARRPPWQEHTPQAGRAVPPIGLRPARRLLERQREGIAKAKAAGKYKGRAPTARAKLNQVRELKEAGVGASEIARRLGMGRSSVYRLLG